jgi:hypothetical protein
MSHTLSGSLPSKVQPYGRMQHSLLFDDIVCVALRYPLGIHSLSIKILLQSSQEIFQTIVRKCFFAAGCGGACCGLTTCLSCLTSSFGFAFSNFDSNCNRMDTATTTVATSLHNNYCNFSLSLVYPSGNYRKRKLSTAIQNSNSKWKLQVPAFSHFC